MAILIVTLVAPGGSAAGESADRQFLHQHSDLGAVREEAQASTTSPGWGRFQLDGTFGLAAHVPGSLAVVGLDEASLDLVRYDLETNELITGDRFFDEGRPSQIVASPEGGWVYGLTDYPGSIGGSVWRYRASDLRFDTDIAFGAGGRARIAVVPGDEEALLISTPSTIELIRDGDRLPLTIERTESDLGAIAAFDGARGFVTAFDGLHEFSIDADGVSDLRLAVSGSPVAAFEPRDAGRFEYDGSTYQLPDLVPRPTTPFDRAVIDPDQPYRYGDRIYSQTTGTAIASSYECDRFDPRPIGLGGGWVVTDDFVFFNLLDRCGAYGEYVAVDPARVFDTRAGEGFNGEGEPLLPGDTRRIRIHGLGGVPADGVESVVLNVTGVRQRDAGDALNFITVWPAGFPQPEVSNLNLGDGDTVGNMVTVSTGADGSIDVYSGFGVVDLTVDVLGYFTATETSAGSRSRFEPTHPTRLLDTRVQSGRLGAGASLVVDVSPVVDGHSGPPIDAVVVNVTAIQPTRRGFFKIYPADGTVPNASAMNFGPWTNTNRLVTVSVDDGDFTLLNDVGSSHVTVDIVGVYRRVEASIGTEQRGRFVGIVPFRIVDTREASPFDGDGRIPGDFVWFLEGYRPEITLATNLTAIRPTDIGFMSAGRWTDEDIARDFRDLASVSSLNYGPGAVVSNHALVTASTGNGGIAVFNSVGLTHFALDVFGFYTRS